MEIVAKLILGAAFGFLAAGLWCLLRGLRHEGVDLGDLLRGRRGGPGQLHRLSFGLGQIVLMILFLHAVITGKDLNLDGLLDGDTLSLATGGLSALYLGMKNFNPTGRRD
ncbi:MAG: hypothetical protein H6983_04070 [Ectothiorhodospiraceae bacterium]|nr:hypothetical protein [Chromatiales bacterium]MCP5153319.1 hypothetical protein [Ectothiorhodospiraceae bacterium]